MQKQNSTILYHILAGLCCLVWGTTFLVSKLLLETFTPTQVIIMRALLAYAALWILCPKWKFNLKDEGGFLLMALFGNTIYYLCENTALLYTYSSNVSILVSAAPIATAILMLIFRRKNADPFTGKMMAGTLLAFLGMCLVVLNGALVLHLSLKGDLLSIAAAFCWGIYSILLPYFNKRYSTFFISRKLMFYGALTCLPILLYEHQTFPITQIFQTKNLAGILFLGLIGSAFCYVAWTGACTGLGVVKANLYIYVIPFITLAASALCFQEKITLMALAGAVLIAVGMKISA